MIDVRITELLKSRGKSPYWLARRTGLTYAAMSNLCKSKTLRIEFATLNVICRELECQPGDVLVYLPDPQAENKKEEVKQVARKKKKA